MTWTYDAAALDEPVNEVRLLIGDTDSSDPLLQNEEIQYYLDNEANAYYAASEACLAIAARFQTFISSKGADGKNISYSMITDYNELAVKLRAKAKRSVAGKPYAGGTSKTDKEIVERDTDRDAPAIELGMHDQEGTETSPLRAGPIP